MRRNSKAKKGLPCWPTFYQHDANMVWLIIILFQSVSAMLVTNMARYMLVCWYPFRDTNYQHWANPTGETGRPWAWPSRKTSNALNALCAIGTTQLHPRNLPQGISALASSVVRAGATSSGWGAIEKWKAAGVKCDRPHFMS